MNWYYMKSGNTFGPVTPQTLKQLAAAGEIEPQDKVRNERLVKWIEACKVRGLFAEAGQGNAISPIPLRSPPPLPPAPPPMPVGSTSQSPVNQRNKGPHDRKLPNSIVLVVGLGGIIIATSCIAVSWLFFGGRNTTTPTRAASMQAAITTHIEEMKPRAAALQSLEFGEPINLEIVDVEIEKVADYNSAKDYWPVLVKYKVKYQAARTGELRVKSAVPFIGLFHLREGDFGSWQVDGPIESKQGTRWE